MNISEAVVLVAVSGTGCSGVHIGLPGVRGG